MKRNITLSILGFLVLMFASCNEEDPGGLLDGEWQLTGIGLQSGGQQLTAITTGGIRVTFTDNSFESNTTGTWTIDEGESTFAVDYDGQAQTFALIEQTSTSMSFVVATLNFENPASDTERKLMAYLTSAMISNGEDWPVLIDSERMEVVYTLTRN